MNILTLQNHRIPFYFFFFTYGDYKPICLLHALGVLRVPSLLIILESGFGDNRTWRQWFTLPPLQSSFEQAFLQPC